MATLTSYTKSLLAAPRDIQGDIKSTSKVVGTTSTLADQIHLASGTSGSSYFAEPQLLRMTDDRILFVYWRGTGHVSDSGAIYGKIVDNDFSTLVSEFVIADDALPYDTRNCGITQTECGNFAVFYRLYNYGSTTTVATKMVTSTDGINWSTPTDISNIFSGVWTSLQATSLVVPFSKGVKTANGYMQCFYNHYEVGVLFSEDGLTWGTPTVVYTRPEQNITGEPVPVRIDDDRIVIIVRCNDPDNSYGFLKSSDGGLTWTALSSMYAASASATNAGAPMAVEYLSAGEIAFAWALRTPVGELTYNVEDAEAFWTTPQNAWATGRPNRQIISTSSGTTAINFGYQTLLRRYDNSVMVAWYDQKSLGTEDQTDIRIRTVAN